MAHGREDNLGGQDEVGASLCSSSVAPLIKSTVPNAAGGHSCEAVKGLPVAPFRNGSSVTHLLPCSPLSFTPQAFPKAQNILRKPAPEASGYLPQPPWPPAGLLFGWHTAASTSKELKVSK